MTIKDLNPKNVWSCFYDITQIPRPSKKEAQIIAFLLDFAKKHQLPCKRDEIGNVLISKPASKGFEHLPTVILQSHVDMVCEKNNDVVHNFDEDPIETYIDGDWVKARGTTLGADNGMGVAAQLAILASNEIEHGKLECLFTVDEETGLTGAEALKDGFLSGEILINLDTEEEGELCIGCAGGKGTNILFAYTPKNIPGNYFWFRVKVSGLNGGHSGGEIHKGLGNANKILNRYLWTLSRKVDLLLAEIDGGNLHNAIAREAHAIAGVPMANKEDVIIELNHLISQVESELRHVDPNVKMTVESSDAPAFIIDKTTMGNLLDAIYACPHGVLGMSPDIEGLVETSTNLASVKMKDHYTITIGTSQRSSTESLKIDAANRVNAVFTLAGASVNHSAGYPGWKPNKNSPILEASIASYQKLYGVQPQIKAVHAGLECGLFLKKYPFLDMVSCGPTITEPHSPAEQINIPSVEKWWNFLLDLLKNIPTK